MIIALSFITYCCLLLLLIGALQVRGRRTIATAAGNLVALLTCCTDAAATATVATRAALGLALVVLEDEEIVRTNIDFGA